MSILIETAYLPPVAYMKEVLLADVIVIEAYETYTKQTCRNHCTIYGPNGSQTLSIPVIKVNGNHTITGDIRISEHQPWQRIHWRSIETAYNNSPFFLFYQDLFAPFYEKKYRFLVDWNLEMMIVLLRILKLNRTVSLSEYYEKNPMGITDLRGTLIRKNTVKITDAPHYTQVFEPRCGFIPGLSVMDVIFNLGPESKEYISDYLCS
ncbi:MAG: WbqC family protein [Bacteroidota bacterium]